MFGGLTGGAGSLVMKSPKGARPESSLSDRKPYTCARRRGRSTENLGGARGAYRRMAGRPGARHHYPRHGRQASSRGPCGCSCAWRTLPARWSASIDCSPRCGAASSSGPPRCIRPCRNYASSSGMWIQIDQHRYCPRKGYRLIAQVARVGRAGPECRVGEPIRNSSRARRRLPAGLDGATSSWGVRGLVAIISGRFIWTRMHRSPRIGTIRRGQVDRSSAICRHEREQDEGNTSPTACRRS